MCSSLTRAWIEIRADHFKNNIAVLKSLMPPGMRLMPALKAEAYGHGLTPIAQLCLKEGLHDACTATLKEACQLRTLGFTGTLLVLGYVHPADVPQAIRHNITLTGVDLTYLQALSLRKLKPRLHLAVDTGMHRLGLDSEDHQTLLEICRQKEYVIDGIFTHLCTDDTQDKKDRDFTYAQYTRFQALLTFLKKHGHHPSAHLLGSYGLLNYPSFGGDFARIGLFLFGVMSRSDEAGPDGLRPVLSLRARLASVRTVHAGESLGYGLSYTFSKDSRIGTVSIGYADGVPRALSNQGNVLIHGHRCPIVGQICMDQMMIDLGDLNVAPGDVVTLIGEDHGTRIEAAQWAEQTQSITNEILSRLGSRLPRVLCTAPLYPKDH